LVAERLTKASAREQIWRKGMVSGTVYHGGDDVLDVITEAFRAFAVSNPLHPDVFPEVRKMEAEVVQMCCAIFNGSAETCGTMTSGGTESIVMAIKTYRDWSKAERGIEYPELVKPTSAHAAFDKACHYFGIKLVEVPVDPVTFKVDVAAVRRATNRNTIAIVASALTYPQGVTDDIPALAKIALEYKCGLHVDNCLGSLMLPFLPDAGYKVEPFDFKIKGVTSMSADTHKYGFAPKGSSVIMYSSSHLRHYQYYVAADWTGGIYATPSIAGSRPGAIIAGTWAAMMYMGKEGYVNAAKEVMKMSSAILEGVRSIPQLKVLGEPAMSVICFAAAKPSLNIFNVGDAMTNRGWSLSVMQNPSAIHICVTYIHTRDDAAARFVSACVSVCVCR
jgi:sphinganine-1-phosphate aldolase